MLPVSDYIIRDKKRNFILSGKVKLKVLIFLAIIITASFFSQMVLANNLATDGHLLSKYEAEIKTLESVNTSLKVQIARETSLATLNKKANKLGFSNTSQIITP